MSQNRQKNIEAVYPLSPLQQGMLFHYSLNPERGMYFEQFFVKFRGNLDIGLFEAAWESVVQRHPALRTSFVWKKLDRMLQVVHRDVPISIIHLDWRNLSEQEQEKRIGDYARQDRRAGFDLSKAPLLRFHLIRLKDDIYQFIWSFHHLLADGWSIPIILKEVFMTYEATRQNVPLNLSPVRPYKDYINWLQKQDIHKAESYWRKLLQDFTSPTSLTIVQPSNNKIGTDDGYAKRGIEVPINVSDALFELSRQQKITMNTIVQAAWSILLSRYSHESDIVFGATVSGRPAELSGVENIVGMFINTLPVRVRFQKGQRVTDLLRSIQHQSVESREYDYTPLVEIHGWSGVPRDIPLFDTIVVFENYPVDHSLKSQKSSIEITDIASYERTNYPITFVASAKETVAIEISYETNRVRSEHIDGLLRHLNLILKQISINPQIPIDQINLIDETERNNVIFNWNGVDAVDYEQYFIQDRFTQIANKFGKHTAIVSNNQNLSYDELEKNSNKMAHYLRKDGVGPDTLVGLFLERSSNLIVAILAILKAGGAYVPLDTSYPRERLSYMLNDSNVPILITTEKLISKLPQTGAKIILINSDWQRIAEESDETLPVHLDFDNLAYMIYTSGSTGAPKGSMITHRGLTNYVNWALEAYPLREGSGSIVHSTIAFDATVTAIFPALLSGKRVVLTQEDDDIEGLANALKKHKDFSLVKITPAHLDILKNQIRESEAEGLTRCFVIGGENLTKEQIEFWQVNAPRTLLFNEYGPTETVVGCVVYEAHKWRGRGSVPIGRAIPKMRAYILDEKFEPVPIGIVGELFIGGEGVARGYLNRPELTGERFLPDPYSPVVGARMYRTGDLVRYNFDGQMEFIGRADFQVKLRGYRIELGEIESVLKRIDFIKDAIVVLREDHPGHKYLVGYIITDLEEVDKNTIRIELRNYLPEYMIPLVFVKLDAFPLTVNGKINRRALPMPDDADVGAGEKNAEQNPIEELLESVWKDILKVKKLGPNDNFFDLGGHSIIATQMISRVRDVFGVELQLRQIFETPVLSDLALKIEELKLQNDELQAPPIEPVSRNQDIPLSFSQQRLWFLDQLAPDTANYNIPTTIRLKGKLDTKILQRSIEEIVHRHEILRTTFKDRQGEPVQIIHENFPVKLQVTDLSDLPKNAKMKRARELAREDALKPFDLAKGPLFRVQLIRFDETDHLALINLHHIITDAWSMGVLIREIATVYNAFVDGNPSPLSDLPIQYADYAIWQRNWLQGGFLEKQLQFWKEYIGDKPTILELPTDHPRPALQTFNGRSIGWNLPKDLSQKITVFSQKQGATLFMTLLAAFQALLHRYSQQDQIFVGSPIANRTRSKTEGLIGFFVNTLVFKANFSEADDFKTLLKQVRENALQAYAHQDLPFEQLVEAIQPERDLSHSPLFQVAFILQNAPFERLKLKNLTIEPFPAENPTSKYDLTLYASENDDGIHCFWEYNTDLFEEPTIRRMMQHFQNMLSVIVDNPEQKIDSIDFLTDQEKELLFKTWNQTQRDFPDNTTVHALFEELTRQQPNTLAAQYKDQKLTCAELNRKANQYARYLLQKGLQQDDIVGFSLPRSLEVLVAILGILKAGGAFLAIDPSYPADRIAHMIQDSGLNFVITNETLAQTLPVNSAQAIIVDQEKENIDAQLDSDLDLCIFSDNLSYVIYTSGSTGKPKGTLLPHRGLCNLAKAQQRAFSIKPESRILQFASLSFDASVWEMVMALLNGATLVLTDQETLTTGQGIAQTLKTQHVSTVTLPPSVLAVLPEEELPELRTIITAGEKCTSDLVQRWGKGRQFVNAYGPTETTVCASMYQTDPQTPIEPPIGKPIDNFQLYVVDQHLMPVPVGVPGELCIAGVGLARGYINRPDLTADCFVANPFSQKPGERMYRSGDLVRWLPDGNLEFLGRIDHQVKLRGFRIELGEIEAVLTTHEKIRDAVVLVREDTPGEQRLVGYYVTEDGEPIATTQLKNYLKKQLPEYMIPLVFIHLETMPLTPNGKVDRKKLPAPDRSRRSLENEYVAPRNENEEKLAAIVAELLNLQKVGVYDNFFDLGGHSLLATKFMSRIREQFQVELPLRTLFEKPTIAELAEVIEQNQLVEMGETIERVERETERLEDLLADLESMSDEEVQAVLYEELDEKKDADS